jgi:hypothetical protein
VAYVLAVDWADASKALFSPVNLISGYEGHSAFYLTWLGTKTSQYSRTAGVLASVGVGWALRKARSAPAVLAASALIFLLRPLSEAISYTYYWSPFMLLAGLVGVAAHGRLRARDWLWPVLAIVWASPRGTSAFQPWWWLGESILLSLIAAQTMVNCGMTPLIARWSGDVIKKIAQAPIFKIMSTETHAGEAPWIR